MTNNNNHPIIPPPELVEEWASASARTYRENGTHVQHEYAIATQAARWGADAELEACCKWLREYQNHGFGDNLRVVRRPKPLSLKEQALEALDSLCVNHTHENIIRRALESLPS